MALAKWIGLVLALCLADKQQDIDLVGEWTATPEPGTSVALMFRADSTMRWATTMPDREAVFEATYSVRPLARSDGDSTFELDLRELRPEDDALSFPEGARFLGLIRMTGKDSLLFTGKPSLAGEESRPSGFDEQTGTFVRRRD